MMKKMLFSMFSGIDVQKINRQWKIPLFISLVLGMNSLYSCQKEELKKDFSQKTLTHSKIVFNVSDQTVAARSAEDVQTVLGDLRGNPFTVQNVAQAHNNLYGTSLAAMVPTHFYVKFSPDSLGDIHTLEKTNEFFYDFSIEYEVITMGDYYQEPIEGVFPDLYAIVSPDFVFPNVQHQIINQLYLDKSDRLLLMESFKITGNVSDIESYVLEGKSGLTSDDFGTTVQGIIPPEPDCLEGGCPEECLDNCRAVLVIVGGTESPPFYDWICECAPPPPPPPPPIVTNDCNCPVGSNPRKPGGCINVEDTELSNPGNLATYEPVRRVKVIMKDSWFTEDETWTDDNGCWGIDREYSGVAWMWVKFKNDRCRIRGPQAGNIATGNIPIIWQWITTIKDYVGKLSGPVFNDIQVSYHMWDVQGSQVHRYWGAATVNNSLHEFHDDANQDGISAPSNGLDINIDVNDRFGFALMGTQHKLSIVSGSTIGLIALFVGAPFAPLAAVIGWAATLAYLPDIHIGVNFTDSDRLKSLAYHEIAHASHYEQVGNDYWWQLVLATSKAGGHGTANSNDAGRLAICESWAEYLGGHHYVDRTYGGIASIGQTWEEEIEETWNEVQDHIPIGLHHDLVDVGEPPRFPGVATTACNQRVAGCTTIVDNVNGFTNAQLFSCLTSGTIEVDQYQDCLIDNHIGSTSNSIIQVNDLFNSY